MAACLAKRGFAVLRFDFTGLGASEGEFANTNFSSNVQDLLCAVDFLRRQHRVPAVLIGHSLGDAASWRVGSSSPTVVVRSPDWASGGPPCIRAMAATIDSPRPLWLWDSLRDASAR